MSQVNKFPKVSVIIGIYNCANTLQEALDSLYNQTFQDFEIILCDDGSVDNTYEVAKTNEASHDNIVLLRNERNLGLNVTLNKCLSTAKGEYIARMDGDDISISTRFEKEVQFLDSHPEFAIVSSPMIYFDEKGEFGRGKVKEGEPRKETLNYGAPFCHAPCMIRKQAYLDVDGYSVDSKLLRVEDYNLWMKLFARGYRGYNLGEHLYAMRDDRNAVRRRTVRARMNGIYAHWLAYKTLDLSFLLFLKYAVGNIIRAYAPSFVYDFFHQRNLKVTS